MALFAFVPNYGRIEMAQPWAILTAFSALPAADETYLAVEWTLRYEVLFYFIFTAALVRLRLGIVAGAFFLAIPVIGRIVWPDPMNWMDFFYSAHIYQFFFGMITAAAAGARPSRWPVLQFGIGIALFCLGWWWQGKHGETSWDTLLLGVAASMIIHALVSWECKGPVEIPEFLLFSGRASYALYLAHFPLLWLTAMALGPLLHAIPLFLICLILLAAALFGSISFHLLVERPLISAFRHLAGRKWLPPLPSTG
jgi:peptidoglycan/LPS O-acetylase OafA/YrhL